MKCYICEKQSAPNGTRYHVRDAVGICQNCGIAVCEHHARKAIEPSSPLLCEQCFHLFESSELVKSAFRSGAPQMK